MRGWFKARWRYTDWLTKGFVVALVVFAIVSFLATSWLNGLSNLALAYILTEWGYWQTLGRGEEKRLQEAHRRKMQRGKS